MFSMAGRRYHGRTVTRHLQLVGRPKLQTRLIAQQQRSTMQCLAHGSQQLQARSSAARPTFGCFQSMPCIQLSRRIRHQRSVTTEAARQDTQQKTYPRPEMTIDNLDETYCNDFECTSSPAVEQTVRQLARDITRFKYNTNYFQPDVQFNDGFRSFKGSDKYRNGFWARESLQNPRAVSVWLILRCPHAAGARCRHDKHLQRPVCALTSCSS